MPLEITKITIDELPIKKYAHDSRYKDIMLKALELKSTEALKITGGNESSITSLRYYIHKLEFNSLLVQSRRDNETKQIDIYISKK